MLGAALQTPSGPQLVGRYVLYGAIASGGMATVHFGRLVGPAGFARPVAIKRLHAQFARDPDFVRMFLDEARLAARVAHPNVVQTLDLVETADEIFLVMEYVRGLSLASLVRTLRRRGERVPPRIAAGIVVGVLEGLHAAHEAKDDKGERLDLVHRDVSPHNVLVGTDGVARLLDFGVAKAAGRLQTTRDGMVKGKVAYMAPEQVEGLPLTRRTDVFAASVLLWEVVTGRRLFYGENDADSLRRVLNDPVPPPSTLVPDLPPELDRVVLHGVERNAAARYATAHEMALELAACTQPAAPTEIGGWVERTAAEELNERASLIAAIERLASESGSYMTSLAAIPGAGAPDAPTPVGRRRLDPPSTGDPAAGGATGSHSRAVASHAGRSGSRLVAAVAASILLATLAFTLLLAVRARSHHDSAASVAASAAATAPGPAGSTVITPRDEAIPVEALPPLSAAPQPSASALHPASASIPLPRNPARGRTPSGPSSATEAARPAGASCDPPYVEDAQGHIHFKPSCL
jgi:serine/threonine-protein kinase